MLPLLLDVREAPLYVLPLLREDELLVERDPPL